MSFWFRFAGNTFRHTWQQVDCVHFRFFFDVRVNAKREPDVRMPGQFLSGFRVHPGLAEIGDERMP